ncbi:MAG: hypothetical protein R3F34_02750 [Planctomycetota bacterium]
MAGAGLLCGEGPPAGPDAAPCGRCPGCKKVAGGDRRGNHPDLFLIDPLAEDETMIKIDRIAVRDDPGSDEVPLEQFLSLRPSEGGRRIAIVRDADRMNASAQNALLKMLEEPLPGAVIVLVTSRPTALLPTIRSRVVRLALPRLDREATVRVLRRARDAGDLPGDADVEALATLADGAPGAALDAARQGLERVRSYLLDALEARGPVAATLASIWGSEGEFAGSTKTAKERERVRAVAILAASLVVDVERIESGLAPRLHVDLEERLRALPARGAARLAAAREATLRAVQEVERNLDAAAAMERLVRAVAER